MISRRLALVSAILPVWGLMAPHALAKPISTLVPGKLLVCLYPGFAPFAEKQADGSWTGWDVDYLEAFADSADLSLQVVEIQEFKGIWNAPGAGRCDIAGTGVSDLRERRLEAGPAAHWSRHYYNVARAFLVRTEDRNRLNRVEDLSGKSIIVTDGSTAHHDIINRINLAKVDDVKIGFTQDEGEAAKMLLDTTSADGPFAYGGGLGSVQLLAASLGGLSVVWTHCNMFADGSEHSEPFSFIVRSQSNGLGELLDQFIGAQDVPYPGGKGPSQSCAGGDP